MPGQTKFDADNINVKVANGPAGTFTLGAAATTVVNNTSITAASLIFLQATNAAAATLMGGVKSLFISARSAGASFSVRTGDNSAAGGTETFNYWLVN